MTDLTRRRSDNDQHETWHIYFGDVRIGTIGIRAGVPISADQWPGILGFIQAWSPARSARARLQHSTKPAPHSSGHGSRWSRRFARTILKFGGATAISTHGSAACKLRGVGCRRKTPTAGRGASAASRSRLRTRCTSTPFTGRRMNKHVEKRPFAEPEAAARKLSSVSSSRASQASGKTRQWAENNPGSRPEALPSLREN